MALCSQQSALDMKQRAGIKRARCTNSASAETHLQSTLAGMWNGGSAETE